ncbi:uncharacterized protein LOC125776715 [Bactrocera dorsalis]|uniref:Uncharacterized protein LOC125776715 n=1 Tax=Bactrocera dorsalis TaxID=27457 RepID=A0A034WMF8_BACDO|nr:uncharacterized protein LOC125776715 [Bactrocera dorsalis]
MVLRSIFWEIPTPQILCYYFLKIQGPRCGCFSFVIKHLFSTEQLKQWKATILMQWKLGMHSILLSNRLNLGKKEAFLSATVQKEMEHISAVDERVSKEEMQDLSRQFYESCIKYIEKGKEQFDHIMIFAWCALDQPPQWKFIETTAKYIATNNHFDLESSDTDLFDQFMYLERYVTEENNRGKKMVLPPINAGLKFFKISSKRRFDTTTWSESYRIFSPCQAHQPPLNEYFL